MLNRSDIYALLMLQKRGKGLFAPLPNGGSAFDAHNLVIRHISDMVDPTSQIHPLLVHIVNGRKKTLAIF